MKELTKQEMQAVQGGVGFKTALVGLFVMMYDYIKKNTRLPVPML
ncbi:bacteriocin [Algivirga pacifica]|uniref:Bacteriocin n=1 Tax=Algivirga pacifica TaxID=1162670 RepID=A0ABP9DH66_9BACT